MERCESYRGSNRREDAMTQCRDFISSSIEPTFIIMPRRDQVLRYPPCSRSIACQLSHALFRNQPTSNPSHNGSLMSSNPNSISACPRLTKWNGSAEQSLIGNTTRAETLYLLRLPNR